MRLVDADKLIKQLDDDIKITSAFVEKSIRNDNDCDFYKFSAILNAEKSYRAIVEDMKTAFDVEKVIEQLEKESYYIDIETDMEVVNLNEAIEIVKAGEI